MANFIAATESSMSCFHDSEGKREERGIDLQNLVWENSLFRCLSLRLDSIGFLRIPIPRFHSDFQISDFEVEKKKNSLWTEK